MKDGDIIETTNTTIQVAKIIGIHPNTVRIYEDVSLISKPRTAFQIEVLENGLRKKAVSIVKLSALCEFD